MSEQLRLPSKNPLFLYRPVVFESRADFRDAQQALLQVEGAEIVKNPHVTIIDRKNVPHISKRALHKALYPVPKSARSDMTMDVEDVLYHLKGDRLVVHAQLKQDDEFSDERNLFLGRLANHVNKNTRNVPPHVSIGSIPIKQASESLRREMSELVPGGLTFDKPYVANWYGRPYQAPPPDFAPVRTDIVPAAKTPHHFAGTLSAMIHNTLFPEPIPPTEA